MMEEFSSQPMFGCQENKIEKLNKKKKKKKLVLFQIKNSLENLKFEFL